MKICKKFIPLKAPNRALVGNEVSSKGIFDLSSLSRRFPGISERQYVEFPCVPVEIDRGKNMRAILYDYSSEVSGVIHQVTSFIFAQRRRVRTLKGTRGALDPIRQITHSSYTLAAVGNDAFPPRTLTAVYFTAGGKFFSASSFALFYDEDYVSLPEGVDAVYPFSMTLPLPPHIEVKFPGGRVERTRIGRAKLQRFTIGFKADSDSGNISGEAVEKLTNLFDTEGVMLIDFENEPYQKYFVRRVGDLTLRISNPYTGTVDFGQITLEVAA